MTAPPQARPCSLYRIIVWDPWDLLAGRRFRRLGYLGETARLPIERLAEHLRNAYPWGDTIVAIEIDERAWADKGAVLRAEREAVGAERPLYNVEWNGGNPDRIGFEEQVRQRWARDDAAGRPRWRPGRGQGRRPRPVAPVPARRRVRVSGWWVLPPVWLLLSTLVWAVFGGGWDAVAGSVQGLRPAVGWSPVPAALFGLWLVRWAWRRGARWGRRRRRR